MAERVMTEKQIKAHRERIAKMHGEKRPYLRKAVAVKLRVKPEHSKATDDKTKEYETRFSNIWLAIKKLESRVIQLESKEEPE